MASLGVTRNLEEAGMARSHRVKRVGRLIAAIFRQPRLSVHCLSQISEIIRGIRHSKLYREPSRPEGVGAPKTLLEDIFDRHSTGHGIWKWRHYFPIYHAHFQKFIGRDVRVLEIGVFSGGSLEMWRSYFGDRCHIYGVDIAEDCRAYANDHTTIFIGDQEDRAFWRRFKSEVPQIDILIDDGGHTFDQQIVTLEEMLPHIRPGGIYVCEDVHRNNNRFNSYCHGLLKSLNDTTPMDPSGQKGVMRPNPLQAWLAGVHFYPYVIVIEKADRPIEKLMFDRRGTLWRPIETP
ncbi:MAG TPA: class I SAM-dependent methyltransferase [Stellaceae bacterium]|nr:class I SAM-dependent methyltransferase [Stellaceae bacterium]